MPELSRGEAKTLSRPGLPAYVRFVSKQGNDERPKIRLLITGGMGSGKGYSATYLEQNYSAVCWSRTETMKRLAHAVVDHVGSPDEILIRIFSDPNERDEVRSELLAYGETYTPEPGKPRRLYQDVTEICQQHDPLCFERELDERIRALGEVEFSLIDDVRKKAALEYFVERGYRTLRIEATEEVRKARMLERDGYLPDDETFKHPSEVELAAVEHEFTIHNNDDDAAPFLKELDRVISQLQAEAGDERRLAAAAS